MFFRPSPDPEIATQPKTAEALQSVQAHRQYQDHVTPMDVVSIQHLKETDLTLTQKLFKKHRLTVIEPAKYDFFLILLLLLLILLFSDFSLFLNNFMPNIVGGKNPASSS